MENNKIVEVTKIIDFTDLERGILNLSSQKIESLYKYKGQKLLIKDNLGCESFHLINDSSEKLLRFSGLTKWYRNRNIEQGTELIIIFDEKASLEGQHIIQIRYEDDESETQQYTHTINFKPKTEKELENIIKINPDCLEPKLKLYKQQLKIENGVCDLVFVDRNNNYVIVELKNRKTSVEVIDQILRYIDGVKKEIVKDAESKVRGIIITPECDEKLEQAVKTYANIELRYYKFNIEFSKIS